MRKQLRDRKALAIKIFDRIKEMIREVFNKEVFGLYEGIIESVDEANGRVNVRVIDLNDLLLTDVRIVTPYISQISTPYTVGTHVILGFRSFKLKNPIILGQIAGDTNSIGFNNELVLIRNGGCSITLTQDGRIVLFGNEVTANGEDLTHDDRGLL